MAAKKACVSTADDLTAASTSTTTTRPAEKLTENYQDDGAASVDAAIVDDIAPLCHPPRSQIGGNKWYQEDDDTISCSSTSSFELPEVHETLPDKDGIKTRTEYRLRGDQLVKITSKVKVITEQVKTSLRVMERRKRMEKFGGARRGGSVTTVDKNSVSMMPSAQESERAGADDDQKTIIKKLKLAGSGFGRRPTLFPNASGGQGQNHGSSLEELAASTVSTFRDSYQDENDRKLQVCDLSIDTTEEDIRRLFLQFFEQQPGFQYRSAVQNVYRPKDMDTEEYRSFAFVTMCDRSAAEIALDKLQGHRYDHTVLFIRWAPPKKEYYERFYPSKKKKKTTPGTASTTAAVPKAKKEKRQESPEETKKGLTFKAAGQAYARVEKMLGGGHCELCCFDGRTRLGRIAGRMRHKRSRTKINAGDIVIVEPWSFQDEKCEIIHKYDTSEARKLLTYGELPPRTRIGPLNDIDRALLKEGIDEHYDMGIDFDYSEDGPVDLLNV